jgi:putative FmdB family regulatory protein
MPCYTFRCRACSKTVDLRLTTDEIETAEPPECPRCGELTTRLFATPVVRFKGNGFYSTDNRRTK